MKLTLITRCAVAVLLTIFFHPTALSQEVQPTQPPPSGDTLPAPVLPNPSPGQNNGKTNNTDPLDTLNEQKNSAVSSALLTSVSNGQISEDALQKLNDASQKVKNTCSEKFRYYAKQRNKRAALSTTAALVGSVAGGIIAPAILAGGGSKVAAAAFSGLSGATNTAQTVVAEQGYTAEASQLSSGKVREGVKQALDEYLQAYTDTNLNADQRLVKMKAALMKADDACFLGEY